LCSAVVVLAASAASPASGSTTPALPKALVSTPLTAKELPGGWHLTKLEPMSRSQLRVVSQEAGSVAKHSAFRAGAQTNGTGPGGQAGQLVWVVARTPASAEAAVELVLQNEGDYTNVDRWLGIHPTKKKPDSAFVFNDGHGWANVGSVVLFVTSSAGPGGATQLLAIAAQHLRDARARLH
jgi:hypothetical protein